MRIFLLTIVINVAVAASAQTAAPGYTNPALTPQQRAHDLVTQRTLRIPTDAAVSGLGDARLNGCGVEFDEELAARYPYQRT